METEGGVKLTKKQIKNVEDFKKLMNNWDENLCLNAIAGKLHIMLLGDTKQNKIPEKSDSGGFNEKNCIYDFYSRKPFADGGDW